MKKTLSNFSTALVFGLMFLLGCNSTQKVSLLSPEKQGTLIDSSNFVILGTIGKFESKADLTVGENLSGGYPEHPQNGYINSLTVNIESVVKGSFSGSTLDLSNLKDPDKMGLYYGDKIWAGRRVYVGWKSESGGSYTDLKIVSAEPPGPPVD